MTESQLFVTVFAVAAVIVFIGSLIIVARKDENKDKVIEALTDKVVDLSLERQLTDPIEKYLTTSVPGALFSQVIQLAINGGEMVKVVTDDKGDALIAALQKLGITVTDGKPNEEQVEQAAVVLNDAALDGVLKPNSQDPTNQG